MSKVTAEYFTDAGVYYRNKKTMDSALLHKAITEWASGDSEAWQSFHFLLETWRDEIYQQGYDHALEDIRRWQELTSNE